MNRAGHFNEGRFERAGGMDDQLAHVKQAAEVVSSERGLIWAEEQSKKGR